MLGKYISTVTRSVTVSLKVLEENLNPAVREILLKELQVESLTQAHLQTDVLNDGITFFTISENK